MNRISRRLSITDRYPWDDIESLASKKKSKEELEKEWQEFAKEQVSEFDKLLIEKGIKKQESIITDTNT